MSGWIGLGVGILAGVIIVGLTFFHGRRVRGASGGDCPLDPAQRRQLGYVAVGPNALRRLQGAVPIIFEWHPQPVWRIAFEGRAVPALSGAAEQVLLDRLGQPEVRRVDRALEVVGGDGADPLHHAAAAELLCVLTR